MNKLSKEQIKAISDAIIAHNDMCANDIECIPHHRVMPIVSKALTDVEGRKEETLCKNSDCLNDAVCEEFCAAHCNCLS